MILHHTHGAVLSSSSYKHASWKDVLTVMTMMMIAEDSIPIPGGDLRVLGYKKCVLLKQLGQIFCCYLHKQECTGRVLVNLVSFMYLALQKHNAWCCKVMSIVLYFIV